MDLQRAKAIRESSAHVSVYLQDAPVWIETIDDANDQAEVRLLESGEQIEVPISALVESEESWTE